MASTHDAGCTAMRMIVSLCLLMFLQMQAPTRAYAATPTDAQKRALDERIARMADLFGREVSWELLHLKFIALYVETNLYSSYVVTETSWRDGTTHLVMSPLEFMQRLTALAFSAAPLSPATTGPSRARSGSRPAAHVARLPPHRPVPGAATVRQPAPWPRTAGSPW